MDLDNKKPTPEIQNSVSLDQEVLLNCLVKKVSHIAPLKRLQTTEETVNEVIIESDIDGTHYYLVRCTPKLACSVSLSPRELAIARLVSQGFPNKCVGSQLNISPWTVATHLRRIFGKLNVNSRTAMVSKLMEIGILLQKS